MNIAGPFIRRPIATALVMGAILLFGVISYRYLAVSELPNVDYPTINVHASLPGASPETMAAAVATPLEKQFSTIAGINNMSSTSSQSSTSITLQFDLNRNIDAAAQDVQAAISKTGGQLPHNMPSPPSYQKVNPADSPILYYGVLSDTLPLSTVDEYAETIMAQRISMVAGVAQVGVYGPQKYAVRVQLNPQVLASRGIGLDDVASAISNQNVNLPTGTLWGSHENFTVQARGQLTDAAAYRKMVVSYRDGTPVRLGELGDVLDSVQDDHQAAWLNDHHAIVLAIQRQPGTNTVEVIDAVNQILPALRQAIPPAIKIQSLWDRGITIRRSIADVKSTLMITIFLVIMVIFLFLKNLSATIIPSLSLPMSIIGTFAVMYLLDYSLDNLSLMALTLSVGFVVDDAIVMLENIVRHMEMGEGVMEATIKGSREIGFTILAMTLSLTAVFIPFLFLGGILGRLLHEFAVTIAAAILVSGFVSISLTPMLCSRFLKSPKEQRHGRVYRANERAFAAMNRFYDRTLQAVLRHQPATMAVAAAVVAATVYFFIIIPKGFLPDEDQGKISINLEAKQGASYQAMLGYQEQAIHIVRSDPNDNFLFGMLNGGNTSHITMHLKDRPPRQLTIQQVMQEMRPKLAAIPGVRAFQVNEPPITIGGYVSKSEYQLTLQSPNTEELYAEAPKLEAKLQALPELQGVTTDLQIKNPQVDVEINRDQAATLGVSAEAIEDALYTAYGARQVSTIYAPNDEFYVILELQPQYQRDPSALPLLYVHAANGRLVPLNTLVTMRRDVGPLSVTHTGQLPSVTLSFNLSPGVALGDALTLVKQVSDQNLPADISTSFQGTAQAFQQSMQGLGLLLLMAVLIIYIVLGILYESFIHPITILSGLPAAGFGALLTLLVFHTELSIYAFVGVIMLVGIVKKNAIMMIDYALEAERTQGLSAQQAIYEGCRVRFRPIMMTTMAALMGTLPIALGTGMGSEARRPLGLAVVGGLVFSQFLTLYITPVVYIYMDRVHRFLGRSAAGAHAQPSLGELAPTAGGSLQLP